DLHAADVREADLRGADLRGSNLQGAKLDATSLEGADLTGVNLEESILTLARLIHCTLQDANVENAVVDRTQVYGIVGLPRVPTRLRLDADGKGLLTGENARTFFSMPAVVEVFLTERLSEEELGCYHF